MRIITQFPIAAATLICLGQVLPIPAQQPPKGQVPNPKIEGMEPIVILGELTDDDPRDALKRDSAHKVHVLRLQANRVYQIDLMWRGDKRRMDPFLRIEDSRKNQLVDDDDSGGDYNSRLYFTPLKDDDYRLIATSLYGTGPYTLKVTVVPGIPMAQRILRFEDKLAANDRHDDSRPDCVCKVFKVKMIKGKTYTIDLESGDFDSFLRLEDGRRNLLAEDDDSGGNLNSRILFEATENGTYRVIASSLGGNSVGAFTLTIRED